MVLAAVSVGILQIGVPARVPTAREAEELGAREVTTSALLPARPAILAEVEGAAISLQL